MRTFIILGSKILYATKPSHYRTISLCTTLYKIFTKLIVERMKPILPRLIYLKQEAFISNWSIIDNVIIAQEYMHDLKHIPGRRCLMA